MSNSDFVPVVVRSIVAATILLSAGCASRPLVDGAWTRKQTAALRERLIQLDSSVDAGEASRAARVAVQQSAELAREFRAVRPAWLHNWFVNAGWRERGLCYDWANDLYARLHALDLHSLEIHLAVARMDTPREHNCVVLSAQRQPLDQGVVLDAWRHSGHLWFGDVSGDKYPWEPLPPDRIASELKR